MIDINAHLQRIIRIQLVIAPLVDAAQPGDDIKALINDLIDAVRISVPDASREEFETALEIHFQIFEIMRARRKKADADAGQ